MNNYDAEQLKAIHAMSGYYLVLAAPGCGKTAILAERIAYARQQGIAFEDMLCLTFTNRASRGMRDRVKLVLGEDARNIFIGNMHRFCSNFLYDNALVSEDTSVIDDDDVAEILLSLDPYFFQNSQGKVNRSKVERVTHIDNLLRQRAMGHPDEVICVAEASEPFEKWAREYEYDADKVDVAMRQTINASESLRYLKYALLYQSYKKEHALLDFSDILIDAYEGLRKDTSGAYKRFPWIQIDEVQDLNGLQLAIIDLLTSNKDDFTVMYLGDEQQAIFSFIGSQLDLLQQLRLRCENHVYTLGRNYRSYKYLLEVFNTYAESELGVPVEALPKSEQDGIYNKSFLFLRKSEKSADEDKLVVQMAKYYMQFPNERLAFLVPTNNAADRVSQMLMNCDIPHFKISGTDMFKSRDYKTIMSFLAVTVNPLDNLAWVRLLWGIGALRMQRQAYNLVRRMRQLMMTPADLLVPQTYLANFIETYKSQEIVFFDTETTGVQVAVDDIVQIAAFKVKAGKKVPHSDFNIFLETNREIPATIGNIPNPILKAYAENPHYSQAEGLAKFLEYVGNAPVAGHNVDFDYQILKYSARRHLQKEIDWVCYDSLKLAKHVEPNLRRYKLEYLLNVLNLNGQNSHLANEDIEATWFLVDYCVQKGLTVLVNQKEFLVQEAVKLVADRLKLLLPFFQELNTLLFEIVNKETNNLSNILRDLSFRFQDLHLIVGLDKKFDTLLNYIQSEWGNEVGDYTLKEQLNNHIHDLTTSLNEGDLVNTEGLVNERIFVMTVYKGKGLEFDNVVVLGANDGTYPFYSVNNVLNNPHQYTPQERAQALKDRMEDARKFYVALTRAKKRLCVSYTMENSYGRPVSLTPFMQSIQQFFLKG